MFFPTVCTNQLHEPSLNLSETEANQQLNVPKKVARVIASLPIPGDSCRTHSPAPQGRNAGTNDPRT